MSEDENLVCKGCGAEFDDEEELEEHKEEKH